MAADITGSEKIQEMIRKSGRDSFYIMRPGQNANSPAIYEYEGDSSEDAAQQFADFADLFSDDNNQRYEMHLFAKGINYEGATDAEKRSKKFRSKLVFTFQIHKLSGRSPEGNSPMVIQAPREREVVRERPADMSGYLRKEDVESLIEKIQTNHQIQTLSAEIASLSRKLEEYDMEDEEDEIGEEEEEEEIDHITKLGETLRGVIKDGKDAYLEIKGAKAPEVNLPASRAVAAPSEQDFIVMGGNDEELEEEAEEIGLEPEPAKKTYAKEDMGKLPAFLPNPVADDQQAKINMAINFLYTQDQHIGDDLMLIMQMAKNKPNKFKGLIATLRED